MRIRRVSAVGIVGMLVALPLVAYRVMDAAAAGDATAPPPAISWSFSGPFGTYDRNALRRGFRVYEDVCTTCHSVSALRFRHLGQDGGPEFSAEEVAAVASRYDVTDGPDETGAMFERSARPEDPFIAPYGSEEEARSSNGGAYPPDLSLIAKARYGGADYIHALLTGYAASLEDGASPDGLYDNPYAPDGRIAMPPPFYDGMITHSDGTPATVRQMAEDVVHFLQWVSDPHLEARRRLGIGVVLYMAILSALVYLSMRRVWAGRRDAAP